MSGNNLGDTLFILDLMRQRKEKLMRQKKDEKINEMAMKQKQQKLEARQGMRVLTRPSFGGFVGVGAILANSRCTSPAPRRRTTPKPQEPEVNIPGPDNTEMLIMGILRDKKEEKYHEAHNVRAEQAGVPILMSNKKNHIYIPKYNTRRSWLLPARFTGEFRKNSGRIPQEFQKNSGRIPEKFQNNSRRILCSADKMSSEFINNSS